MRRMWWNSLFSGPALLALGGSLVVSLIIWVAAAHQESRAAADRAAAQRSTGEIRKLAAGMGLNLGQGPEALSAAVQKALADQLARLKAFEEAAQVGVSASPSPPAAADLLRTDQERAAAAQGQAAESARRKRVLDELRGEYIASQEFVTAEMAAGLEPPPPDWINRRLAEKNENFRVRRK
jgi:hypothetical protein